MMKNGVLALLLCCVLFVVACEPQQIMFIDHSGVGNNSLNYTNGTGLDLTGNIFSLIPHFRLPEGCDNDDIAAYNTSSGLWRCYGIPSGSSNDTRWSIAGSLFLVNLSNVLDVNGSILNDTIVAYTQNKAGIGSVQCSGSDKLQNITLFNDSIGYVCGSDLNTQDTRWLVNTTDLWNNTGLLSINYTTLTGLYNVTYFVNTTVNVTNNFTNNITQNYTVYINNYNQSLNTTDSVRFNSVNASLNWSWLLNIPNYLLSSDQRYNETLLIQNVNSTLWSAKLNITDQRYNETTRINALNTSLTITKLNVSDQRYNDTGRGYINGTYANNTYSFKNHTHTNFTNNINMTNHNITSISYLCFNTACTSYIYNNGTHTIIV